MIDENQDSHYITQLDGNLRAATTLRDIGNDGWLLLIHLSYEGCPAGNLGFNLHNHSQTEADQVARNVAKNPFLMKEIDEYLWGESD